MNPAELNLNPIDQLHPVVIVAVMLVVIATYFALRRVYVLPYLRVMEQRDGFLETADVEYVEATQRVEEAKLESERAVAEAAAEVEAMRADARARADEYRRTRIAEATSAAATVLEHGRATIAAARAAELQRLREEAAVCVGEACGQLIGGADDELVGTTIERLLSRQAN